MELNRNHYFMIGVVVLLLGIQVKCVDSYVLSEDAAKVAAKTLKLKPEDQPPAAALTRPFALATANVTPPASRRTVQPPPWLGWALISIGAVLVLHSLAMNKPGG